MILVKSISLKPMILVKSISFKPMMLVKSISLGIVYLFLTGLFKKPTLTGERNRDEIENRNKYSKLIYIVLDALRFDYTIKINAPEKQVQNKMPYFSSLEKFHATSVCGIPTSTTCRVTGLLTGSPSNFLEGAKTFLNSQILIDNLVEQAYKKMSVSFYGDKTWIHLFPFLEAAPNSTMDPYTKKDLLKEEERVMENMIDNLGTCDATFCHLITLDSFGHAFGTGHEIIGETLRRFDEFIKRVYEKMDTDTLLVITSDHGVTDEGAHGGVTQEEMSSFVSFISKRGIRTRKASSLALKLRGETISQWYDLKTPLVKEQEMYPKVHQDDILPTVCYLLGLPIPSNAYGNFIYELVESEEAFSKFHEKKKQLKEIRKESRNTSPPDILRSHYHLTHTIYKNVSGKDPTLLLLCLLLSIYVCVKHIQLSITYKTALLLFLCFYVSFSVTSVINEDLFWLFCFLLFNFRSMNILSSLIYLGIDTKYGIYTEWLAQFKASLFLDPYFKGSYKLVYLILVFFIGKIVKIKFFSGRSFSNKKMNYLSLILSLYKYFFKSHFTPEFNLQLLSIFPSLETLCVLSFRPIESIYLLNISQDIECLSETTTLFILLNLSVGYSGMIKQIQSINYDVAYVFSDNPTFYDALLPSLMYFIYPRFILFKKFVKSKKGSKDELLQDYFFLNFINLLIVFSASFYFFDSMNFYFHFASRCFFVCFYFVIDILIMSVLYISN